MQRDWSPILRCTECGQVEAMLVFERGLDEEGEPYRAIYRENIPHSKKDCQRMTDLARETWPKLF
jgi:hypothetical protein